MEEQLEEGSGESLDSLAGELRGQGIDVDCRSIAGTSAAHALHDAAEDAGAGSAAKDRPVTDTYGGGDPHTPATRYEQLAVTLRASAEQAVEAVTSGVSDVEIEPDVSLGDPGEFLVAASKRLDLLICGSRRYGPAQAVLLGGVSRRVVTEARCPGIVLARGADGGLEALVAQGAGQRYS